jgi:hypothetical protein
MSYPTKSTIKTNIRHWRSENNKTDPRSRGTLENEPVATHCRPMAIKLRPPPFPSSKTLVGLEKWWGLMDPSHIVDVPLVLDHSTLHRAHPGQDGPINAAQVMHLPRYNRKVSQKYHPHVGYLMEGPLNCHQQSSSLGVTRPHPFLAEEDIIVRLIAASIPNAIIRVVKEVLFERGLRSRYRFPTRHEAYHKLMSSGQFGKLALLPVLDAIYGHMNDVDPLSISGFI